MSQRDRSSLHFAQLIKKDLLEGLTEEEQADLNHFLSTSESNARIYEEACNGEIDLDLFAQWKKYDTEKALAKYYPTTRKRKVRTHIRPFLIPAAAALLLFMSIWITRQLQEPTHVETSAASIDFQPASNLAVIQLSDGRSFELDQSQGTVMIDGNGISYEDGNQVALLEEATLATITTPKGGTYDVHFPDGSKVTLNAGSTLYYPLQFSTENRKVSLSGEAYFDIAKSKVPFIVETNRLRIQVLGTSFNVRAYEEENLTATTLVNGKVMLSNLLANKEGEVELKPGQTGWIQDKGIIQRENKNIEAALAWTKGRFDFNGKTLREVMLEIGRWYDVEVQIDEQVPDIEFFGGTFRNTNLSTILSILEHSSIRYELTEDRRLLVSKEK